MEFSISTNAGKASIKIPQRFDMTTLTGFRQAYVDALNNMEAKLIEVDLADVEFIDSSGLGALLLLRERVANAERKLTLINCQPFVMKVMKSVNFNRLFEMK